MKSSEKFTVRNKEVYYVKFNRFLDRKDCTTLHSCRLSDHFSRYDDGYFFYECTAWRKEMSKDYYSQLRNEQNGPSNSGRQIDEQNKAAEDRQAKKESQMRRDAIAKYGCNCDSCCSALLLTRDLKDKNKRRG
jgi:hypothetical protein